MTRHFIPTIFRFFLIGLAAVSCNVKTPSQQFQDLKESVNNDFQLENLKREKFNRLTDSLYSISDSLYLKTINTIDSFIKNDPLVDKFVLADFNTLKGDIHFEHNNFRQAILEYSKKDSLYRKLPPRRLIYRAASHIKLNQSDSAYTDLREALVNKSNYWYLANFFETTREKDSAVYYYKKLSEYDSSANKVCGKRITELSKPKPKYYTDLHFMNN